MLAHVLAPIAQLNTFLLTTPLHAQYLPFPLLPCIHAARVSLAYRGMVAGARKRWQVEADAKAAATGAVAAPPPQMGFLQDLGGFLVMAWGGGFIACYLIHVTPPQLLSVMPLLNYVGVHLAIGLLLSVIDAPSAKMLDTVLPLLDGATRAHAIFVGINLPAASPVPTVRDSWMLALLLGTIAASGGGQLAGTLGAARPDGWALGLPPFLRARSLIECVDVWAPFLGALAYCAFTGSNAVYAPFLQTINAGSGKPILSPAGAKALTTLVVSLAFAWRAVVLHWATAPVSVPAASQNATPSARAGSRKRQ